MDLNDRRNYAVTSGTPEQYKTFQSRGNVEKAVKSADDVPTSIELEKGTDPRQYISDTTRAYLSRMSDMAIASRKAAMGIVKSAMDNNSSLCGRQKNNFREASADLKLQSNSFNNFVLSSGKEMSDLELGPSSNSLFKASFADVISAFPAVLLDDEPRISDRELCEIIAQLMLTLHDDYLEIFQNAVEKQTAYWQSFTAFQSELAKQTASAKDNKVEISDLAGLKAALDKLRPESTTDATKVSAEFILYPIESGIYVSKADAEKWASELGLPKSCVIGSGDKYIVVIDTTPVATILDSSIFKGGTAVTKWSGTTTEYQAWQTVYNAQSENIKTNTQTLTTKYSTANSTYDTIIKLLSSSIQTLFDCCKEALRF